jgi:hypothetical protein
MDGDAHDGPRGQPIAANPRQCRVKAGTAPHRRGDARNAPAILQLPGSAVPGQHHKRPHSAGPNPAPLYRRVGVVLCYLILMGLAAVLSVLLSLVLFAVAITALLPIPRIDRAVRWVMVKLSAILGDSYVLAHCPAAFAAMRSRIARDLGWLQDRCNRVAVVGHSQGAAIAHQVLQERGDRPGSA